MTLRRRALCLVAFVLAAVALPRAAHASLVSISSSAELSLLARPAVNGVFSGVAFDDKHHVYLRVWENSRQVFGVFIGEDGSLKGDVFPIGQARQSFAGSPRVAYSSGSSEDVFLVMFHTDYSKYDAGKTVFGQLIRYVGGGGSAAQFVAPVSPVVGTNFALSGSSLVPTFIQSTGDVVYNPTRNQFLALWDDSRGGYDVLGSLVTPTGALVVADANITSAPMAQGAPSAAYDPTHDRYLVSYQGLHPASPSFPELVGSWAKLVSGADLSVIHPERPYYGLIEVSSGALALEVNALYLPARQGFLSYWTAFGNARDVVGRIIPWNYGDPGVGFGSNVYPLHAMSFNEGAADAEYNPASGTALVPAASDAKVLRGIELDSNGNPTSGSYNLSTPVPSNGSFFPKVAVGEGGRFAVSYITDYSSVWLERFQSGGTISPPPPPPPAALAVSLGANANPPINLGTTVTWTATASGGTGPYRYQFWKYTTSGGWQLGQDYSASNTFSWAPPAGTSAVQVWVRNAGSSAAYDAYASSGNFTTSGAARITSISANRSFPVPLHVPVTWTVNATSSSGPVQYQFWRYSAGSGWSLAQDYSSTNTYTWYPLEGVNALQVWVRTVGSSVAYEDYRSTGMFTVSAGAAIQSFTANVRFPVAPGTLITFTAAATSGGGPVEYKFWGYNASLNKWAVMRDWGAINQLSWTPSQTGAYAVQVWVRVVGADVAYQDYRGTELFSVSGISTMTFTPNRSLSGLRAGDVVTWTTQINGGVGNWEYQFWGYNGSSWILLQPYTLNQSMFSWGMSPGVRAIQVWVRAPGSTATYEAYASSGTFTVTP